MILHDVDEEDDVKPKHLCTAKTYCIQSGDLLVVRERRDGGGFYFNFFSIRSITSIDCVEMFLLLYIFETYNL